MSNVRSRKLLDLAHRVNECTNCGKWSEHGCEPAHKNGIAAGKGFGIKSHDHRHAALCHACHAWYDQGSKRSPCDVWANGEQEFMWTYAHMKTMDLYWANGWLKVTS